MSRHTTLGLKNISVPMTMKTHDTLLSSSSSYRENKNNININSSSHHHLTPKTVGCMSGIFHFISRYNNRRKFLTSGKKHEKTVTSSSSASPSKFKPSITTATTTTNGPDSPNNPNNQRTSCHVNPRSPTLPPEIRHRTHSDSLPPPEKEDNSLLRSSLPPSTLVARLMGLDSLEPVVSDTETRRKLLGQLEKCDRDLKALKKIIDAVMSSEEKRSSAVAAPVKGEDNTGGGGGGGGDGGGSGSGEEESKESSNGSSVISSEQVPSPVSVLDESVTRSPTINRRKHHDEKLVHQQRKKPGDEGNHSACLFDRINNEESSARAKSEDLTMTSPTWVKKAMKESVEQVCKDIAWGQRREVGRIGLALQDHICRDLIEETIREIGDCSSCKHFSVSLSLPFEACKRRLQF